MTNLETNNAVYWDVYRDVEVAVYRAVDMDVFGDVEVAVEVAVDEAVNKAVFGDVEVAVFGDVDSLNPRPNRDRVVG
tara:strand:+ start:142 stop:372 length:231 start_codon:yes stop_codon:yes gene_type:complete